jgi:hypothetical protein
MLPGIAAIPLGSPPAAPVISYVSNDGRATSVSVIGTSAANAAITVYDNGSLVATTTADAGGGWSANNVPLNPGPNSLTATASLSGRASAMSAPYSAPVVLKMTGQAALPGSLSSFTFNNVALGTEHPSRYIIVAIGLGAGGNSTGVSGVTINGIAASPIYSAGTSYKSVFYGLALPTGTIATIVVTCSVAKASCAIAVYNTLPSSTTASIWYNTSGPAQSLSVTAVDCPAGSFAIAATMHGLTSNFTHTWNGLTTKDTDQSVLYSGGYYVMSSASEVFVEDNLNLTITENASQAVSSETSIVALVYPAAVLG